MSALTPDYHPAQSWSHDRHERHPAHAGQTVHKRAWNATFSDGSKHATVTGFDGEYVHLRTDGGRDTYDHVNHLVVAVRRSAQ